MQESHLYEKSEQNLTRRLSEAAEKGANVPPSKNQLIDPLFKMMHFLVQAEERIQIYKEMLTQRSDFSPEPLFSWLSRGEPHIDKRHLTTLFDENLLPLQEEYIKLYFNSYGFKEKIDYSAFINLIFPENTELIKHISVNGIKKYANNSALSQECLWIFLMLVQEEIRLIEGLDSLKSELIPKITRKEIKNLMRIIKKNGESNSLMEIDSRPFVKYDELKALLKNEVTKTTKGSNLGKKTPKKQGQAKQNQVNNGVNGYLEKNSVAIFRRLSMGKSSFISLQDFEFWLRPWNKQRGSLNVGEDCASNIFTISGINEIEESKISFGENENFPLSHRAA